MHEDEARGLLEIILEGVDAVRGEVRLRDTWADEMMLWVELIFNRMGSGQEPGEDR